MRPRDVVLVTSLAALPVSWPAAASPSPQLRSAPTVPDLAAPTPGPAPAAAWDTFTADVAVRRRLVKKDGTVGAESPEMRYRWTRTRGADGWQSTLAVVHVAPQAIETPAGRQLASMKVPVGRIEIGGPGTPTRAFDTAGRPIYMTPAPPPVDAAAAEEALRPAADILERAADDGRSDDWIDQFLAGSARLTARRALLAQTMGASRERVRGLDRFVSNGGGATTELLADPRWAVPVEINVVRDGALTSHTVVTYAEDPGVGLVRRRVRSELLISPESGDRAVSEIDFSNIGLSRGAR